MMQTTYTHEELTTLLTDPTQYEARRALLQSTDVEQMVQWVQQGRVDYATMVLALGTTYLQDYPSKLMNFITVTPTQDKHYTDAQWKMVQDQALRLNQARWTQSSWTEHNVLSEKSPELVVDLYMRGVWDIRAELEEYHSPHIFSRLFQAWPEFLEKTFAEPLDSPLVKALIAYTIYYASNNQFSAEYQKYFLTLYQHSIPLPVVLSHYRDTQKIYEIDGLKHSLANWLERIPTIPRDTPFPSYFADPITQDGFLALVTQFPFIQELLSLDGDLFMKSWKIDPALVDAEVMFGQLTGSQSVFSNEFLIFLQTEQIYSDEAMQRLMKDVPGIAHMMATDPALHPTLSKTDASVLASEWHSIPLQTRELLFDVLSEEKQDSIRHHVKLLAENEILKGNLSYVENLQMTEAFQPDIKTLLLDPVERLQEMFEAMFSERQYDVKMPEVSQKALIFVAMSLGIPVEESIWKTALFQSKHDDMVLDQGPFLKMIHELSSAIVALTTTKSQATVGTTLFYQDALNLLHDLYTPYYMVTHGLEVRPLPKDVPILRGFSAPLMSEQVRETLFRFGYHYNDIDNGREALSFSLGEYWAYDGVYSSIDMNGSVASSYIYRNMTSNIHYSYVLEARLPQGSIHVCGNTPELFELVSSYIPGAQIVALYVVESKNINERGIVKEVYVNPHQSHDVSYKAGEMLTPPAFYGTGGKHDAESVRIPYDSLVDQYHEICPTPSAAGGIKGELPEMGWWE